MNAPSRASAPPPTHTPRMRNGVCTCRATTLGFMKIPDPTMPPITSMVASKTPSCRRTLASSKAVGYHTQSASPAPAQLLHGKQKMLEFCTCGAQLPPDSLFCNKCGKPQRDVIAPEPEPESVAEFVPPPAEPVAAAPQPPALNFHNLVAVRIAFVVAPVAFLLSWIPALNLVLWIAAGFLAVFFHRRRTG